MLDELEVLFGVPVIETYGMTEAASQIAANPLERRKPGSVGKPAGAEIAIMDRKADKLPAGERGEIVLRGPTITRGYDNDDRCYQIRFSERLVPDRRPRIFGPGGISVSVGRIKKADVINRGGQKVSPAEVEEALLSHPDVLEAVRFSHYRISDLAKTSLPPWCCGPEAKISSQKLRRFASERLARFKVPGLIRIVPAIPTGPSGQDHSRRTRRRCFRYRRRGRA